MSNTPPPSLPKNADKVIEETMCNMTNFFQGTWKLERTITNNLGDSMIVTGDAEFSQISPLEPQYNYHEQVMIDIQPTLATTSPLKQLQAMQDYLYEITEVGTELKITVRFPDTHHIFHQIMITKTFASINLPLTCTATAHLCGHDNYLTTYYFVSENAFKIQYKVTGPRKDYVSDTTFRRIGLLER